MPADPSVGQGVTLAEFLLARIDEDEAAAHLGNGQVAWLTFCHPDGGMKYTTVAHRRYSAALSWVAGGREQEEPAAVDPFYDSARVLAECDSKRRIVELFAIAPQEGYELPRGAITLRFLALPYADHSDYNPAWRP